MRLIARCVPSVLQEHLAVSAALRQFTGKEAVFLLGVHLRNKAFLGLEVESHGVALILVASHFEYGCTCEALGGRISDTCGVNQTAVEHHEYFFALQVHILVFHVRVTIQVSTPRTCLVGQ